MKEYSKEEDELESPQEMKKIQGIVAKEECKDFNFMDSTGTSKYFYTKLGNEQIEI